MTVGLFRRRWQKQWQQFAKYLRYVFNDHAILALVFILGAGLVAYQHFWTTMQVSAMNKLLVVSVLLLSATLYHVPATFIKTEDPVYLMGNEMVLRSLRRVGLLYSLLVRTLLQLLMAFLLSPILLRQFGKQIGTLVGLIGVSVVLAAVIMYWSWYRAGLFPKGTQPDQMVNWIGVAGLETKRVQAILHVFGWFVDIPEQKITIKTHVWTDWLLAHWAKHQGLTRLYSSTFLRTNDYMQLWLTITVLGSILMVSLQGWLLIGLLFGLMYLFLIQILPIMTSYRQRVFDHLVPITLQQRLRAFHNFSLPLLGLMLLVWAAVGLIGIQNIKMVLMIEFGLVLWGAALVFLYSDRKAENMFKRR